MRPPSITTVASRSPCRQLPQAVYLPSFHTFGAGVVEGVDGAAVEPSVGCMGCMATGIAAAGEVTGAAATEAVVSGAMILCARGVAGSTSGGLAAAMELIFGESAEFRAATDSRFGSGLGAAAGCGSAGGLGGSVTASGLGAMAFAVDTSRVGGRLGRAGSRSNDRAANFSAAGRVRT